MFHTKPPIIPNTGPVPTQRASSDGSRARARMKKFLTPNAEKTGTLKARLRLATLNRNAVSQTNDHATTFENWSISHTFTHIMDTPPTKVMMERSLIQPRKIKPRSTTKTRPDDAFAIQLSAVLKDVASAPIIPTQAKRVTQKRVADTSAANKTKSAPTVNCNCGFYLCKSRKRKPTPPFATIAPNVPVPPQPDQ